MWILNCLFETAQGKIYFILPLRHQESIHHTNSCLMAFRHRTWFCSLGLARTLNTGNLFGIKRAAEPGIFRVSLLQNKQYIHKLRAAQQIFFLNLLCILCYTGTSEKTQVLSCVGVYKSYTHAQRRKTYIKHTLRGQLMCLTTAVQIRSEE